MNAEYISYESLVAARAPADWAFWSMVGAWISAIATLAAAVIGFCALNGWRKQEEVGELKEFRVAAFRYENALIFAPKYMTADISEQDKKAAKNAFEEQKNLYASTVMMHRAKTRGEASRIIKNITYIQRRYMRAEIDNMEAHKAVMDIIQTEPLLGMCK